MALFGFILNNKVEFIMPIVEGSHVNDKWIAALRSEVIFRDASTNYGLSSGDIFENEKFYRNVDGNLVEIEKDPLWDDPNVVRFAGIIDGEVIGMRMASKDSLGGEDIFNRFKTTLSSNPLIVEIKNQSVDIGWTWDGQNFLPPVE